MSDDLVPLIDAYLSASMRPRARSPRRGRPDASVRQTDEVMLYDGRCYRRVGWSTDIAAALGDGLTLSVRSDRLSVAPFAVARPNGTSFDVTNADGRIGAFPTLVSAVAAGLAHVSTTAQERRP